jgi:glutamate formiminotransferase
MKRLFECVPNFSEGRNPEIIHAISQAIQSVDEVKLIDVHMDADHNRSVFTILGDGVSLQAAAFKAVQTATQLIDLNAHQGTHPRIGAADVVPFIPLVNANMQDAILLANQLGDHLASALKLPVYLYGKAAVHPSHVRLSDLRRGDYEALRTKIATDPAFFPDKGPEIIGKAGAAAVGAREILIAFNIFLDTGDISSAKEIAREIRESSGGLPGLQALGMLVRQKAQVSMNLLDYQRTSLMTVFEIVKQSAQMLNLQIMSSELVGCLPADALVGTSPEELMIGNFDEHQILEHHYPFFGIDPSISKNNS